MPAKKTVSKSVFTKKTVTGKSVRNTPVVRHATSVETDSPLRDSSPVALVRRRTHSKRTTASLITGILMIIVGSTLILVNLVLYSKYQGTGKIVFDNVDPAIADEISKKIVYTTAENGSKDYYSPELDLLVTYPAQKYTFQESTNSVYVSKKNRILIYETGELKKVSSNKVPGSFNNYIAKKYLSQYPKAVVLEVVTSEGYETEQISYLTPNLFDKKKIDENNRLIVSRKIDNTYVYFDFGYSKATDVNFLANELTQILGSVVLSPKNLETSLTVERQDAGVTFKADRNKWQISQGPLSTGLNFRAFSYEKAVKADGQDNYPSTYMNIMTYEYSAKLDEADWQKTVQKNLEEDRVYAENDMTQFKVISQNTKEQIGGLSFDKLVYEGLDHPDSVFLETHINYYGYNPETNYIINISTKVDDTKSLGAQEVAKVLGTFKFTGAPKKLSYLSIKDRILGTASLQIDKSSLVGVNSVVHIFHRSCVNVAMKTIDGLVNSSGRSYDVCMAGFGSGFYVTKDGYVVSNAHVTHWNADDTVIEALQYAKELTGFWEDFVSDVINVMQANGQSVASADELFTTSWVYFLTLRENGLIDLTMTEENYIEGSEPFKINEDYTLANVTVHKKAELIDAYDLASNFKEGLSAVTKGTEFGIKIPDLGLLKVEAMPNGDYPTMLPADPNSVSVGQSIQAIGFPGAADSDYLFSSIATTIPTLTKGTISAIKPNFDNTFKLFQIDASIAHGNSGGPIINENAEVVAVTTYGLTSEMGADFNAGVSSEEIIKLLNKNNIKPVMSKPSLFIKTGADNLEKSYFKWAVRDFGKAVELYPASDNTLAPLVALANSKITAKEDKTPAFLFGSMALSNIQAGLLGGGFLIFVIGSVLVLVVVKRKGNGGDKPDTFVNRPPATPVSIPNTPNMPPQAPRPMAPPVVAQPNPIVPQSVARPTASSHIPGHIIIPAPSVK